MCTGRYRVAHSSRFSRRAICSVDATCPHPSHANSLELAINLGAITDRARQAPAPRFAGRRAVLANPVQDGLYSGPHLECSGMCTRLQIKPLLQAALRRHRLQVPGDCVGNGARTKLAVLSVDPKKSNSADWKANPKPSEFIQKLTT